MRILRQIVDLIMYGNILIALCAGVLTYQTYLMLRVQPEWFYPCLAFFGTLFTYNLDRLIPLKEMKAEYSVRHAWIVNHAFMLQAFTGISALILVVIAIYLPWQQIVFLGHLGFISVAYSLPFIVKGGSKLTLRSIKGLKIFLITYVWASTTVIMPAIAAGREWFAWDILLLFAERALFIFIITLPFDIRDYESDRASNVLTIPGLLGIPKARLLAMVCGMAFIGISIWHYPPTHGLFYARLISIISTLILVYKAKETHHEYYFSGLLDGTMLIQFILVALLKDI